MIKVKKEPWLGMIFNSISRNLCKYWVTAKAIICGSTFIISLSFTIICLGFFFVNKDKILFFLPETMVFLLSKLPGSVVMAIAQDIFLWVVGIVSVLLSLMTICLKGTKTILLVGVLSIIAGVFIFIIRLTLWGFLPLLFGIYPFLKYAGLPENGNKNIGIKKQIPFTVLMIVLLCLLAFYCIIPGNKIYRVWSFVG